MKFDNNGVGISHSGSTLTPVATAFALSIFSQLLHHSFQCIAQLVVSAIALKYRKAQPMAASASTAPSETEIMDSLEHGKSIVSLLLEHGISALPTEPKLEVEQPQKGEKSGTPPSTSISVSDSISKDKKKKKKLKMVDRRRRRGAQARVSSEEDSDSDSDSNVGNKSSGKLERVSSDEDLSVLSDDLDDLDLLESLSESSSSDSEEEEDTKPSVLGDSPSVSTTESAKGNVKKPGKRQFILAVNFPSTSPHGSPQRGKTRDEVADDKGQEDTGAPLAHSSSPSIRQSQPHDRIEADSQLGLLLQNTAFQSAVHTACSIAAEDNSLMALRLFTYWLQSYPIIIATCTQVKFHMCMHMHTHTFACMCMHMHTHTFACMHIHVHRWNSAYCYSTNYVFCVSCV